MKINPYFNKKNRKNKNLGGINYNKKSCLVDLKPLDEQKNKETLQNYDNDHFKTSNENVSKSLKVNIRIAKNYGFGLYFQNLREDIIDKFLNYDEYISFDGLFKFQSLSDLFNFNKDKTAPTTESSLNLNNILNLTQSKSKNILNNHNNFQSKNLNNHPDPRREIQFMDEHITNNEIKSNQVQSNIFDIHIPKKQKYTQIYNESGFNITKLKNNQENEYEIENLRRNLDYYKMTQETDKTSAKLEIINFNKINNLPENCNKKNILEMNNNVSNCMREYSKTKMLNLNKLKEYCSKRKMI